MIWMVAQCEGVGRPGGRKRAPQVDEEPAAAALAESMRRTTNQRVEQQQRSEVGATPYASARKQWHMCPDSLLAQPEWAKLAWVT